MKYYTDGFTIQSNPSIIGGGFTVVDELGKLIKREEILKEWFTNNEGELLGVLYVLENFNNCIISTDSMNTIYWIKKGFSKARPDLKDVLLKAKTLKEKKEIEIIFEPREKNLAGVYNENYGLINL